MKSTRASPVLRATVPMGAVSQGGQEAAVVVPAPRALQAPPLVVAALVVPITTMAGRKRMRA